MKVASVMVWLIMKRSGGDFFPKTLYCCPTNCNLDFICYYMQDPVDDIRNYRYGVYYNPDDPRIIVPKRLRLLGFTFNFARRTSYVVLALILAFILILSIASTNH
jgi:hypothetical protein